MLQRSLLAAARPLRVLSRKRGLASVPAAEAPAPPGSSGFFFTLLSSTIGAAAGAGFSYVALQYQQENLVERAEMARALAALRSESAAALVDYRSRVALLEHEVAGLKRDIAAWGR
jgi:hypothetical protein